MRDQVFEKGVPIVVKIGLLLQRTLNSKMCFGTLSLVLTICKNSTVSMGGVRAEANITRDGEGGKGCLDFPHLSKKLKEKGRIFLVPCVSLCFFQNTHKLTRRLSPLPHTHTVGPNLVSFLPSLLSSLSISFSPLFFHLFILSPFHLFFSPFPSTIPIPLLLLELLFFFLKTLSLPTYIPSPP